MPAHGIYDSELLGSFVRFLVRLPSLRKMTSQLRILAQFHALAAFLARPADAQSGESTMFQWSKSCSCNE
jgi:hypothetical protein